MSFNDTFQLKEPKDSENEDCCVICGNKLVNLKIGYNKKEQLYRYECTNCDAIYVISENTKRRERVLLQGKARNWPEYLMKTFKFPFAAIVIETNDREFFDPEYDGPRLHETVKVLEVFYSMNYGVEALVRKGRRTYVQILSFLEALDANNSKELENYKRWRDKYWASDFIIALTQTKEKR